MARPLRIQEPGAWYHVTARGHQRRAIYRSDREREHFLRLFPEWVKRYRCRVHAFVLMPNHYHLLLETTEPNLSEAMQWLNVSYTVWFNRRHQRVGCLLQGRFKSIVVEPQTWGLALSRYIHLNPVRVGRFGLSKEEQLRVSSGAGAAPDPEVVRSRLEYLRNFRWSSYRAYAGYAKAPPGLITEAVQKLGGSAPARWTRKYRQYVETAVRSGMPESPWQGDASSAALGTEEFVEKIKARLRADPSSGARIPKAIQGRPGWEEVIHAIERVRGEPWQEFRDRPGDWGRDAGLYLGRRESGLKLASLAEKAGVSRVAVSMALKRFEDRLVAEKGLRKALAAIGQLLES